MRTYEDINEYLADFPPETREKLKAIRNVIRRSAPEAVEAISYGMPTFRLNGKNMIHFAAFAHHIGLYATPDGHAEFESELSNYKRGKGSVQFPLDQPLPLDLIRRITAYRAHQLRKGE
jgi:uncharacterized protein YdhG (YjbR/CyaY superfamily)